MTANDKRPPVRRLVMFICLICVAGARLDVTASEPNAQTLDVPITNLFFDTQLRDALNDISAQTGIIIVTDSSVQGVITCEFEEMPLSQALDIMLSTGGFVYRWMGNYVLVGSGDPESPSFDMLSQSVHVKLDHISAAGAHRLLPRGHQEYVQFDEESNTISIHAPPKITEQIQRQITELDVAPQQVLLNARIVVLEQDWLEQIGLQWEWPQAVAGAFSNDTLHGLEGQGAGADWPWGIQIGYSASREFTNSLSVALNLMSNNNDATVMATPSIMTEDTEEASFSMTTEEYFEILTRGFYESSELEKIESGTILNITPAIKSDSEISLAIRAEVSDVVSRGANNLPVVTRRVAESVVRVEDGGTAVVAGILDARGRTNNAKVPYLNHIPIFGRWLFTSRFPAETSRQVAVFITPELVGQKRQRRVQPERETVPVNPRDPEAFRREIMPHLDFKNGVIK